MSKKAFDKAIIYDDNCPLCAAYTSAFIKGGFLQKQNRISFSEVNLQEFKIDWEKAKHEIPLIDLATGEVKYGVDALADILQQKIFFIKPLLKIKFVNWFFKKLYQLISFNRKIIVASTTTKQQNFDCTPNYSFFWRWILIAFSFIISNIFLNYIIQVFELNFLPNYICIIGTSLLLLMAGISVFLRKKVLTEIAAHLLITLLITSFLVFVLAFFKKHFNLSAIFFLPILPIIFLIVVQQIVKRCNYIIKY